MPNANFSRSPKTRMAKFLTMSLNTCTRFLTNTDKILSDSSNYGLRYHHEVCELIEATKNLDPKDKLPFFVEFARKYTIIPSLWLYWYKSECQCYYTTSPPRNNMPFKNHEIDVFITYSFRNSHRDRGEHYYLDYDRKNITEWSDPHHGLLKNTIYNLEEYFLRDMLYLPHLGMEKLFSFYNNQDTDNSSNDSTKTKIAIKKYETALKLLENLKANEENPELWIKYLKETHHSKYIINSCEYRLGNNPENKGFWMCYLHHLKESGKIGMLLKTYSRYGRLFLGDNTILEKWFTELTEARIDCWPGVYSGLQNFVDRSDYYDSFNNFIVTIKELQKLADDDLSIPTRIGPTIQQIFALPKDTIEHIAKTASPKLLQKLQKTCKYFWHKNDVIYCHRLKFYNIKKAIFLGNSLIIRTDDEKMNFKNLHIGHYLFVDHSQEEFLISRLITQEKLHSCNLKYLQLSSQRLTFGEFEFLVSTKILKSFDMYDVVIRRSDIKLAKLEEIFEFLPNVELFKYEASLGRGSGIGYTSETAFRLAALKRNAKFLFFKVNRLPNCLDPKDFAVFIKNNAAADAGFVLSWIEKEWKDISEPIINETLFADKSFLNWKLKIAFGHGFFY